MRFPKAPSRLARRTRRRWSPGLRRPRCRPAGVAVGAWPGRAAPKRGCATPWDHSGGVSRALQCRGIGDRIQRLELTRNFSSVVSVSRLVSENDQFLRSPGELGPTSPERAVVATRMSLPGIVMFYAALDSETAVAETATAWVIFPLKPVPLC